MLSHDKRGVSATYLARELELTYPTAWLLLHKIRKAMRDRDANYPLAGLIELDDAFLAHLPKAENVTVVPRKPLY